MSSYINLATQQYFYLINIYSKKETDDYSIRLHWRFKRCLIAHTLAVYSSPPADSESDSTDGIEE